MVAKAPCRRGAAGDSRSVASGADRFWVLASWTAGRRQSSAQSNGSAVAGADTGCRQIVGTRQREITRGRGADAAGRGTAPICRTVFSTGPRTRVLRHDAACCRSVQEWKPQSTQLGSSIAYNRISIDTVSSEIQRRPARVRVVLSMESVPFRDGPARSDLHVKKLTGDCGWQAMFIAVQRRSDLSLGPFNRSIARSFPDRQTISH